MGESHRRVYGIRSTLVFMVMGFSPLAMHPTALAAMPKKAINSAPQTDDEKTLYALGVLISHNLDNFQLSPAEFDVVKAGLVDGTDVHHHRNLSRRRLELTDPHQRWSPRA